MVCVPAVNVETDTLAKPEPLSWTAPKRLPPSKKAMEPVGVPEIAVTVAVKVTCCPTVEGFGLPVTLVVVVAAGFTTCVKVPELGSTVAVPE